MINNHDKPGEVKPLLPKSKLTEFKQTVKIVTNMLLESKLT